MDDLDLTALDDDLDAEDDDVAAPDEAPPPPAPTADASPPDADAESEEDDEDDDPADLSDITPTQWQEAATHQAQRAAAAEQRAAQAQQILDHQRQQAEARQWQEIQTKRKAHIDRLTAEGLTDLAQELAQGWAVTDHQFLQARQQADQVQAQSVWDNAHRQTVERFGLTADEARLTYFQAADTNQLQQMAQHLVAQRNAAASPELARLQKQNKQLRRAVKAQQRTASGADRVGGAGTGTAARRQVEPGSIEEYDADPWVVSR